MGKKTYTYNQVLAMERQRNRTDEEIEKDEKKKREKRRSWPYDVMNMLDECPTATYKDIRYRTGIPPMFLSGILKMLLEERRIFKWKTWYSKTPFPSDGDRILAYLKECDEGVMFPHLMRAAKLSGDQLKPVLDTLIEEGFIRKGKKPARYYYLEY